MGLSLFFFLVWLFCALFTVLPKKLSLVENTIIYLLVLIININFSWIIIEELELVRSSDNPIAYTAFLLNRSVLIPVVVMILLNLLQKNVIKNGLLITGTVGIMLSLSIMSSYFKITDYLKWNYGWDILYYLFLNLCALLAYKAFKKITNEEVNYT